MTIPKGVMCHNPGTWHNCFWLTLTSEELCQRTNCKTKYKLGSQNPLGNNRVVSLRNSRANVTWEQLCQSHLKTIFPVSPGNNRVNLTWKKSCHCRLGTNVPISLGKNRASVTWDQSCLSRLKTKVPVSLGKNRATVTWEQSFQCHLGTILLVTHENNRAGFSWKHLCYCHLWNLELLPIFPWNSYFQKGSEHNHLTYVNSNATLLILRLPNSLFDTIEDCLVPCSSFSDSSIAIFRMSNISSFPFIRQIFSGNFS